MPSWHSGCQRRRTSFRQRGAVAVLVDGGSPSHAVLSRLEGAGPRHRIVLGDAAPIERSLRAGDPPIVGRLQDGRLLLDLRTVLPEQDALIVEALTQALGN